MNYIIKVNGGYIVVNSKALNKMCDLMNENGFNYTSYEAGTVPFTELPAEVQAKAKSILRAFNQVTVTYENQGFEVSASISIRSKYPFDHCVCGTYKAEEIYTPEERKQNFLEEFGYIPAYMK